MRQMLASIVVILTMGSAVPPIRGAVICGIASPDAENPRGATVNDACFQKARRLDFSGFRFLAPHADASTIRAGLSELVATENVWIASLQLTNGALAEAEVPADGEIAVNPYFADIAMMALLKESARYGNEVTAYLDWHFAHLNNASQDVNQLAGTIYDYTIVMTNGTMYSEKPTQVAGKSSYDSTDSYAATFLTLLREYVKQTRNIGYIEEHADQIDLIVNAMLATLQTNGLTEATPVYPVQYLMDNCEVFQGLTNAAVLYRDFILPQTGNANGPQAVYAKILTTQRALGQAIEANFWKEGDGYYESSLENGLPAEVFAWTTYYQSAVAQLFPVTCGVIPASTSRARALYRSFCAHYQWENLSIPDEYYWGHNAYAAALLGDTERALTYLGNYRSKATPFHEYPLYNADAAWAVLAASEISDLLTNPVSSRVWCANLSALATNAAVTLLDDSSGSSTNVLSPDPFGAVFFWLPAGDYVLRVLNGADAILKDFTVSDAGFVTVSNAVFAITRFNGASATDWTPASLSSNCFETLYATNITGTASWARTKPEGAKTLFMRLRIK